MVEPINIRWCEDKKRMVNQAYPVKEADFFLEKPFPWGGQTDKKTLEEVRQIHFCGPKFIFQLNMHSAKPIIECYSCDVKRTLERLRKKKSTHKSNTVMWVRQVQERVDGNVISCIRLIKIHIPSIVSHQDPQWHRCTSIQVEISIHGPRKTTPTNFNHPIEYMDICKSNLRPTAR